MPDSDWDWEEKLNKRLRRQYTARQMNDTKWRGVWTAIADLSLCVSMTYADDPSWNLANSETLWGPFSTDYVQDRGIRDPGIGGPFLFKQILSVRVPKIFGNDTDAFLDRVGELGKLPVTTANEYIEIVGYR